MKATTESVNSIPEARELGKSIYSQETRDDT